MSVFRSILVVVGEVRSRARRDDRCDPRAVVRGLGCDRTDGQSQLASLEHVQRGYAHVVERLVSLGAQVAVAGE